MSPNVETVIGRLFSPKREGTAYVDKPLDKGGPTKFGITIPWLSDVIGKACTAADIEALTPPTATDAYATWMMKTQLAALPSLQLMDAVTDYAVHSGLGTAINALHTALKMPLVGVIGPVTLAAVSKDDPLAVACAICSARLTLWVGIFEKNPSQTAFEDGWITRMADVLEGMSE